ncbi:ABC transporter [Caulobacter sp. SLTY]|uniref:ABC-type transport auxiliary lipoprotein family protein n=1 Tax=Caulobacter sp. SLTY TaxID=2683262 RepID=UPI001412D751|nr:ABC transporter [Caulobacter sp. SLTY]
MKTLLRTAVLAAAALGLGACITLFPEAEPSKLYRFEIEAPSEVSVKTFDVSRGPIAFDRAASGDGLLTVTNGELAYIDSARWGAPAAQIFEEELIRAFQAGNARLVSPGEMGRTDFILRLDVQRFEVQYRNGPEGAPVVVVEIKAAMRRNERDGTTVEKVFKAEIQTSDNRVSAIVPAYNTALTQTLTQLNSWVVSLEGGR